MSSGEADAYYNRNKWLIERDELREKGLATEEVPYSHETRDYWYEKYQQLRKDVLFYGSPLEGHVDAWLNLTWLPFINRIREESDMSASKKQSAVRNDGKAL